MHRELTVRAIVTGAAIGIVLAVGNLYLGLKIGFWDPGFVTAAILGFAVLSPFGGFHPAEHNAAIAVTTSASSTPSVMGLLGAIPALALLGASPSLPVLAVWAIAVGVLGVLTTIPLRQVLVVDESLPFPTARAAVEVIQAAHAGEPSTRARARTLLLGALGGGAVAWFRDGFPKIIPGNLLVFATSATLLGGGALIGLRTGLELAGGALGVFLFGRYGHREGDWIQWPGVALMLGSGLTALVFEWRSFLVLGRDLRKIGGRSSALLVVLAAGAVVAAGAIGFGVPPLLGALGVIIAVPLIAVFMRAYAQTDFAHFGALGQLAQVFLGAVSPGAAVPNIAAASVGAGAGAQSMNGITSLRMGMLLGAGRTGPLVAAQIAGIVAGTAVTVPAYVLLDHVYGIGSKALPVPFAGPWKAMGLLAQKGIAALPEGAFAWSLGALAVSVAITLVRHFAKVRWLPSPMAVGIGLLIPIPMTLTIALGAILATAAARFSPKWSERHVVALAAGVIAGESVLVVVAALLTALGVI